MMLDYEALSKLAREKAKCQARLMYPPEQADLIKKKEDELYCKYYRQFTEPPMPSRY